MFQQIADGQRELIESYSVKKRHFIGNTSMDACLSFIMANHGRVKPNDIVYDPFVGTGIYIFFISWWEKLEDCVSACTTLLPGVMTSGAQLILVMIPKDDTKGKTVFIKLMVC